MNDKMDKRKVGLALGAGSTRASLSGADIIIEPEVSHIGYFEFKRVDECIRLGEKAAQEAIPKMKQ